jgi:hypothetical protein
MPTCPVVVALTPLHHCSPQRAGTHEQRLGDWNAGGVLLIEMTVDKIPAVDNVNGPFKKWAGR